MPLVSVITPVHDGAATLAETVASVRAQSLGDWEMHIIDDGSTDGSRALAEGFAAEDPRIQVTGWADNRGPAAARNAGIRAANGRFIAFVDADDLWLPEKLARQTAYMIGTGAGLGFTGYERVTETGEFLGRVAVPERIDHAGLLRGNVIASVTAMYDREVCGLVEMPDVRRRQDYGLWLRLLRNGAGGRGINEVLARYRVRRKSLSSNKLIAAAGTWALYREVEEMGRARAAWCLVHNLSRATWKRLR